MSILVGAHEVKPRLSVLLIHYIYIISFIITNCNYIFVIFPLHALTPLIIFGWIQEPSMLRFAARSLLRPGLAAAGAFAFTQAPATAGHHVAPWLQRDDAMVGRRGLRQSSEGPGGMAAGAGGPAGDEMAPHRAEQRGDQLGAHLPPRRLAGGHGPGLPAPSRSAHAGRAHGGSLASAARGRDRSIECMLKAFKT